MAVSGIGAGAGGVGGYDGSELGAAAVGGEAATAAASGAASIDAAATAAAAAVDEADSGPLASLADAPRDFLLHGLSQARSAVESQISSFGAQAGAALAGQLGHLNDLEAVLTGGELVEDAANFLSDQAIADADGEPISSIEFTGHGMPGTQIIGPSDTSDGRLQVPLTDSQRQEFARLGENMAPDGRIVLGGCNVARGDGTDLMREIAEASGRQVVAGEALQLPLAGIEGTTVVVHPDGHSDRTSTAADQAYDRYMDWKQEHL